MTGLMSTRLVFIFILAFAPTVFARQFDFKSAGFGTYFRGEYGLAVRGDASFADSSGANVSFDSSRTSNAGGEFGLMWGGEKTTFRLSAEILYPRHLSDVIGSSAGGTKYYDLDSKVTVFIPQANLDFVFKSFAESLFFYSIGGGLGLATTQNIYKMTAAGTTAFPGVSDHTETGKGQSVDVQTSVAYEMMFADHATFVADVGYRYLRINALTTPDAVTTFSGTYKAGDSLKNNDGGDRSIDLSGFFAGAGFRFYF
jgi:hypothetical protein